MEIESRRVVSRGYGGGEGREPLFHGYAVSGLQMVMESDLTLVKDFSLRQLCYRNSIISLWNAFINQTLKGLLGPSRLSPEAKALPGREL